MTIELLEALSVLGRLPWEELPQWAAEALLEGQDSEFLRRLAGCSVQDREEIRELFDKLKDSLGFRGMSKPEALRTFGRDISQSILAGRTSPLDGAQLLWTAAVDANIPGWHEFDGFIYAASEMPDRPKDRRFFEDMILAKSRQLAGAE